MDPLPAGLAGSGGGEVTGSAGSGGMGGDLAPPAQDGGPQAEVEAAVEGRVIDLRTRLPVAMARVSVEGRADVPAVMTDADGRFELPGVPSPGQVRIEKPTYVPDLVSIDAVTESRVQLPQLRLVQAGDVDAFTGGTSSGGGPMMDPAKGHLLAEAFSDATGTPVAAVNIVIAPAAGGMGPFYLGADDLRDPALTTTGPAGSALFVNVNPGQAELRFQHATLRCVPLLSAAGQTPDSVVVTVAPGTLSTVRALCTP
jgi:hypothetical protein